MRSPLINIAAGVGLVVLAIAGTAATRPPAQVAGRPTFDRAQLAADTFPYPHLAVVRLETADGQPGDARIILDDGSVEPAVRVFYQVPATGDPVRAAAPFCDPSDMICWGTTSVDPALTTRIELDYLGVPCTITGSPAVRTTLQCSEPAS